MVNTRVVKVLKDSKVELRKTAKVTAQLGTKFAASANADKIRFFSQSVEKGDSKLHDLMQSYAEAEKTSSDVPQKVL